MDAKLNELAQNFRRFKAAFIPNDFNISVNLLSDLKVMLTEFSSLMPLYQDTPNAAKELEITEDQDAFERDFFQLKHYYTNVRMKDPTWKLLPGWHLMILYAGRTS